MNTHILGIDEITYGANDLARCKRFFTDWGLTLKQETGARLVFETLNTCRVIVSAENASGLPEPIEAGPTLREAVWGVATQAGLDRLAANLAGMPGFYRHPQRLGCLDPNGAAVGFQLTRKIEVELECAAMNTWAAKPRLNQAAPIYDRAVPIEVGHVVFFVKDLAATERFYTESCGFVVSDRYPQRGTFLRCNAQGGHHDLFLLQLPQARAGLNHVAFTVRDIHEVFGGGMHMARCGWDTQLGPGRHPISSAYFWYFNNPAGGLIEYYADEDQLDESWLERTFEPGPTLFAEWAIDGGLDGHSRRQKNIAASGTFLTEKQR